jgi:DNA-binding transcriptional ArsR family regulator
MSKPIKLGNPLSKEELDKVYKTSREYHARERLMAIRLASQGEDTLEQIGSILKRGRATIARWLKSYREGGIENLLHRGHGGRTVKLWKSLIKFAEAFPKLHFSVRFRQGSIKGKTPIRMLEESQRHPDLALPGVWSRPQAWWCLLLKAVGSYPAQSTKKNTEKLKFKREIVSRLKALDIPIGVPVHIWIEDEHRSGLKSILRRCWTIKGHEVTAKYEWSYTYGAADIVTSRAEFLYTPAGYHPVS